jgi:hypothetical protein
MTKRNEMSFFCQRFYCSVSIILCIAFSRCLVKLFITLILNNELT